MTLPNIQLAFAIGTFIALLGGYLITYGKISTEWAHFKMRVRRIEKFLGIPVDEAPDNYEHHESASDSTHRRGRSPRIRSSEN